MKIKPGVFYLIELDEIVEFVEYFDGRIYVLTSRRIIAKGCGVVEKGYKLKNKAVYLGEL